MAYITLNGIQYIDQESHLKALDQVNKREAVCKDSNKELRKDLEEMEPLWTLYKNLPEETKTFLEAIAGCME